MTDIEFWRVMAINVEQAQTMPEYWFFRGPAVSGRECAGLCSMVNSAFNSGLIPQTQYDRLYKQISIAAPCNFYDSHFYWKPRSWQPRVLAMRRIAAKLMESAK